MTTQPGFQISVPSVSNKPVLVKNGVLYGADALMAAWISDRLGSELPLVPFVAFGICAEGTPDGIVNDLGSIYLIAGAYWHSHRDGPDMFDISCSVASDTELVGRPDVIRKILEYAFEDIKVPRITAHIVQSNDRAIRSAEKLGFEVECVMRASGKLGDPMVQLVLTPDQCPIWTRKMN